MKTNNGLLVGILTTATLLPSCTPQSYTHLRDNLDALRTSVYSSTETDLPKTSAPAEIKTLPYIEAQFCVERAVESYDASRLSFGWDITLLVVSGIGAGVGTSLGAATAAMSDTAEARDDLQIGGVTTIAAAGAILALRTALALDDVGRAQRIAAARNANAAITIIERYAVAEDPASVTQSGLEVCRDEDINIANAFPGNDAATELRRLIERSEDKKEKAKDEVASATKKQAELPPNADPRTKKAAELEVANAKLEDAKAEEFSRRAAVLTAASFLRRAVLYLTRADVAVAAKQLKSAIKDLDDAKVVREKAQNDKDATQGQLNGM